MQILKILLIIFTLSAALSAEMFTGVVESKTEEGKDLMKYYLIDYKKIDAEHFREEVEVFLQEKVILLNDLEHVTLSLYWDGKFTKTKVLASASKKPTDDGPLTTIHFNNYAIKKYKNKLIGKKKKKTKTKTKKQADSKQYKIKVYQNVEDAPKDALLYRSKATGELIDVNTVHPYLEQRISKNDKDYEKVIR